MLKGQITLALIIILSGCSGMPANQTSSEENDVYAAECSSAGHQTGTHAYLECIRQNEKMAQAREQHDNQKQDLLEQVRGRDFHKTGRVYINP